MKSKIRVTRNTEFQRVQFRISERIGFKLKLYGEEVDATENSIVNGLLENFTNEVSIYKTASEEFNIAPLSFYIHRFVC